MWGGLRTLRDKGRAGGGWGDGERSGGALRNGEELGELEELPPSAIPRLVLFSGFQACTSVTLVADWVPVNKTDPSHVLSPEEHIVGTPIL